MKFLAPLLLILSILPLPARPPNARFNSRKTFNGPDRTITWRPWQQNQDEFRFRTGDRYLGLGVWERCLGFEQLRTSSKAIRPPMIRLGNEHVREEVVIRPGCRYAILKVTDGTMTGQLAALSSAIRIPMGIHFLSDILCGAAIGTLMVLASQRSPIPRVAFKLPELQRKWPVAFCLAMFVVTYSLATFAVDLRSLANAIPHHSSDLVTGS